MCVGGGGGRWTLRVHAQNSLLNRTLNLNGGNSEFHLHFYNSQWYGTVSPNYERAVVRTCVIDSQTDLKQP